MADELSTKRIINLPAESAPAAGDVFVVDNETTGTKKLPVSVLTEATAAVAADVSAMQTATAGDVGKALKAKTVADGKVTEWEFGEAGATVELDDTLTDPTKAAQAKAVGDALSQLITKVKREDGNVVNMSGASITATKNLQGISPVIFDNGVYYSNPFVTTNTVILTFKPVDSEGNTIGMTKNGQAVSVIGEGWGNLHTFTVSDLEVVKRSYNTFHNFEINWKDGSPETYILESAPDHWIINGYARETDSNLNVGLTKGSYDENYVAYSEPYYEWVPTGLLEKYPYIAVDSESEFTDETKIYRYNESLYFYDGENWTEIANANALNELDALSSGLSKNKEAVSQLVAEISQNDGNVVNMSGASITATKNLQNVPPVVIDNGVYYSNPFVTTNTVILTFKPVDSGGNAIGMTKDGQAVSVIGEGWGKLHTFAVSDLTVVAREYTTFHNFEINWGDGFPQTYTLESVPDHWVINGYARETDSNLNVGLTKGSYDENYISYSDPYYEWEPVKLLKKYPYIIVNSEEEFNDETKVYRCNGYLYFYDGEKWTKTANVIKSNFLTIAHRGYGDPNLANALISFVNAANVGFCAVEIDCRQTADGIYVAAHGDTKPLYSNGQQQSYTISTTSWADLKGKTIDAAGLYPLATVAQIFNTLRHLDMEYFVIDLKTGTNKTILDLANRCGVPEQQIMLSYYSMDSLINDLTTLEKHPSVAIRFTPGGTQEQFDQIREALPNMLYSDINVSESYAVLIPNSLSWGVPILCSGVQESTVKYMAPIAAGAMSQTSLQYSPSDFQNMIALDYDQFPALSADKQSIALTANNSTTVTITSTIDDLACYAFAYSADLTVFRVSMSAIGVTSTFTITANNQGTADLIVFTATGEQLTIPVTVS